MGRVSAGLAITAGVAVLFAGLLALLLGHWRDAAFDAALAASFIGAGASAGRVLWPLRAIWVGAFLYLAWHMPGIMDGAVFLFPMLLYVLLGMMLSFLAASRKS